MRSKIGSSSSNLQMVRDAKNLPKELQEFLNKWTKILQDANNLQYKYYVKLASFHFRYNNTYYQLKPEDINASSHTQFEYFSNEMQEDLISLGAEEVFYYDFMD